MIGPGTGVRVYLACGITDMRKGIEGLAALTQDVLRQKPTGGAVFAFRGRMGDRLTLLYWVSPWSASGPRDNGASRAFAFTTRCFRRAAFRGRTRVMARCA